MYFFLYYENFQQEHHIMSEWQIGEDIDNTEIQ